MGKVEVFETWPAIAAAATLFLGRKVHRETAKRWERERVQGFERIVGRNPLNQRPVVGAKELRGWCSRMKRAEAPGRQRRARK